MQQLLFISFVPLFTLFTLSFPKLTFALLHLGFSRPLDFEHQVAHQTLEEFMLIVMNLIAS